MFAPSRLVAIRGKSMAGVVTRSAAAAAVKNYEVKHEPENKLFYLDVEGKRATLDYRMSKECIILEETTVPGEIEGKGLGKLLAQCALDYVAQNNLQMKVNCTFIDHYINKYAPQYKKYLAKPKNT